MFHFIQLVRETSGKGGKKRQRVKLRPNHLKMDYNLVNADSKFLCGFLFFILFFLAEDYSKDYTKDYGDYEDYEDYIILIIPVILGVILKPYRNPCTVP